jgi:formylglycine-generating enzyme required for sulfatase activity
MYHPACRRLLALCLALLLTPTWAQKHVALVIGNSAYAVESSLTNPVNDAQLMARTLVAQGFAVDVKTDLPKRAMELAIASFVRRSAGADSAVLYYAGHGAQPANGGRNFLLPVDAKVEGDDTLETDGIAADRIVEQMERSANPAKIRLVVLDACRNNRMAGKTRSGVRGLARMSPSDDYTLIAFSTNDQDVAQDGIGANSPYAQALAKHLGQAGEFPLRRIFELTATDVRAATNQKQKPRTYGDLDSRMLLNGTQMASIKPEPTNPEQEAWDLARRRDTVGGYEAYVRAYPQGRYAQAAQVALAGLKPAAAVVVVPDPPLTPRPPQTQQAQQQPAQPARTSVQAGQVFKDCQQAHCPEMVAIAAGSFVREDGKTVSLAAFAMAQTETSTAQYMACVADNKACQPPEWAEPGSKYHLQTGSDKHYVGFTADSQPVVGVNLDNARQYAAWVSGKTGQRYQLPSEAQWEYAARAGTTTEWSHGNSEADLNNYAWYNANSAGKSHAVKTLQANPWNLHDMHGNVWEWVQDCYINNYSGAPTDERAAGQDSDRSCSRVVRGGSWNGNPFHTAVALLAERGRL